MQIEVEVKGQQIKRLNSPGSVEDTLNYLTCHFTFDGEEWDNTVKTAHFQNYATKKIYSALLTEGNTCVVPWEALTDQGFVKFSVAGERENYRITTDTESFYNGETVYGGNPSEPPTPDQYDQLIALAEQTKEIAESVRSDADAGEFDGPPGPQGPKGEDGDPGPQGPAGKDGQNATDEQVQVAVDAYMEEHPAQVDAEDIIKLAIKNEASGAVPVVIADSAEMGVQDMKMQGWTEQDSYEGKNLFDADKAKQLSSWIGTGPYRHFDIQLKPNTTYTLFVSQNNMHKGYRDEYDDNFALYLGENADTATDNSMFGNSGVTLNMQTSYTFTTTEVPYYINLYFYPNSEENLQIAFDELLVNMMLVEGSSVVPYEPYTGNAPSPSPDYPQEIVSAGKYDEGTGKYQYTIKISDSEESPTKSQTVTLTADRPLTKWDKLEKRDGVWGWVYKSAEIVCDGSETWFLTSATSDEYQGFALKSSDYNAMKSNLRLVCDKFAYSTSDKINTCRQEKSEYGLRFVVSIEYVPNKTVADWENWLQSNPITVLYQLAEPTFVPLSESEQEALNALHTYYPTTVLSNDAGCEMTIKYIADTKAYIDSKIAAIQAAVVNRI